MDTVLERCGECLQHQRPWRAARSVFRFEGLARRAIHRFKYSGDVALTRYFAQMVHGVWSELAPASDYNHIVPVPLHWAKRLQRGYNQTELLAVELSALIGVPVLCALKRRRWTPSQAFLTREQRQQNLQNAFATATRQSLQGVRILLLDDVFTTGATLQACAGELFACGVAAIDVLTIARG